jgi:hypothetical protein
MVLHQEGNLKRDLNLMGHTSFWSDVNLMGENINITRKKHMG